MNQFRVVNSLPTILTLLLGGLLFLVCMKFPIWGVIAIERKLDVYPIVSRDTIATIDEMTSSLEDFSMACEARQAYERDLMIVADCYGNDTSTSECVRLVDGASKGIDEATADMYAAVARRKALAAEANWSLLKTMALGTQAYTHSTWLYAPASATFSTQINVGFTPTYDPPAT